MSLTPGKRVLLFDLDKQKRKEPAVVAAACRVDREEFADNVLKFRTNGIAATEAVVLIASRRTPAQILIAGKTLDRNQYDIERGSIRLPFLNTAEPLGVEMRYR